MLKGQFSRRESAKFEGSKWKDFELHIFEYLYPCALLSKICEKIHVQYFCNNIYNSRAPSSFFIPKHIQIQGSFSNLPSPYDITYFFLQTLAKKFCPSFRALTFVTTYNLRI